MSEDWGNGVSRTLSAINRQFSSIVWQASRPPLDSEQNLASQIDVERMRQVIRSQMPSGFLMDPTRAPTDFVFHPNWANRFRVGAPAPDETQPVIVANVNGWVIPLVGTGSPDGDLSNVVDLMPPPDTDQRIDFVFLEVWQARVNSNPSVINKPSASTLYPFGNVLFGGTNLTDDLEDGTMGHETTARIQVQYRLRVAGGGGNTVALNTHPDGLGDSFIFGQGTNTTPQAGLGAFVNMRTELGDPSLWRAGDGNAANPYGTVDGFVYAIPICAIFRRGSNDYTAIAGGNPTHNGAFDRTPRAKHPGNPTARELGIGSLTGALSSTATSIVVTNLGSCGFDDPYLNLANTFLVLDEEIVGVSTVNLGTSTLTITRGRNGTAAVGHVAGTVLKFNNLRPDGLYADQIAAQDVLDLRHAVNAQDWDYNRLLAHNVAALTKGTLHTAWKQENKGVTIGPVVHEVDSLIAGEGPATPNYTARVDGPDGIRTVWSDGAAIQPDVTILCDNNAPQNNGQVGITTDQTFDLNVDWDVGPDFHPSGFMNSAGAWANGSTILLFTGGEFGNQGVRGTFNANPVDNTRGVRLLTPKEYWRSGYPIVDPNNGMQTPVTLRFVGERALEAAPDGLDPAKATRHVGPMYPWRETNFERPFIVLGGILETSLRVTNLATTNLNTTGTVSQIDLGGGFNFDTLGSWFSQVNGEFQDDPKAVTHPLFHGLKTLYGMLTDGGRDSTGASSEVYVVLYGDNTTPHNNGAFKVIGVGTSGMTNKTAASASTIVVEALDPQFTGFAAGAGFVTVEFRSQYTHSEDLSVYNPSRWADVAIVLTDMQGFSEHPWKADYLGHNAGDGYDLSLGATLARKLLINTTFMYHPGHGATARVADEIVKFARVGANPSTGPYLRQSPSSIDPTFPGPAAQIYWDANHAQLWNRLPALGWSAPHATNYGGNVVGYTEQDREHELFVDRGSKTVIFRPFRSRLMTVDAMDFTNGLTAASLLGPLTYTNLQVKDPKSLFTTTKKGGFAVPYEFMPRFGRQDIPCYKYIGESPQPFMPGINHLFLDVEDVTQPVFGIIGGEDNASGGNGVKPLLFVTGLAAYGVGGTTPAGTNNQPYIGARRTMDINNMVPFAQDVIDNLAAVNSSDFGRGLKGIQLPPYYGVSRLIGVYEALDFVAQGGRTVKSNRWEPDANPATNLLRSDVDQQTLFILQDGAQDMTSPVGGPVQKGDHTYVIPSNVLDLTRIPGYVTGQGFEHFQYVVVTTVFGFARDFINGNNQVLIRHHNGQGSTNTDASIANTTVANELQAVGMVIPCAAGHNDQFYVAYNRTVYQGDVYMSREGASAQASDYEVRYGQLSALQQYNMRLPIQQYDSLGVFVPETPHARAFEVLASMDFYTTLGTGKVGGQMYPGTPLDVGYVQNTPDAALRQTASSNAPQWQVYPRAYSEGQKTNASRAQLSLLGLGTGFYLNIAHEYAILRLTLLDGAVEDFYFCRDAGEQTYLNTTHVPNIPSTNIFRMDVLGDMVTKINAHPALQRTVKAQVGIDKETIFTAVPVGSEGNRIRLSVRHTDPLLDISTMLELRTPFANTKSIGAKVTGAYLFGGQDEPMNGGNGNSQVNLTGMTERLPLGALLQDSDFVCENPLGDAASAMKSSVSGPRPIQSIVPLTNGGEEYDRFMGEPGCMLAASDGFVSTGDMAPYRQGNPNGTRIFRLYRGGGPLYILSEDGVSGGPVEWVSDSFPAAVKPVLKGGVLACRALLVRNFHEEVGAVVPSEGDEIQMVIATYGILGDNHQPTQGYTLGGMISPSGYGEGYAAADRFRIAGRPMFKGNNRKVPDPSTVTLAVYPDKLRGS